MLVESVLANLVIEANQFEVTAQPQDTSTVADPGVGHQPRDRQDARPRCTAIAARPWRPSIIRRADDLRRRGFLGLGMSVFTAPSCNAEQNDRQCVVPASSFSYWHPGNIHREECPSPGS